MNASTPPKAGIGEAIAVGSATLFTAAWLFVVLQARMASDVWFGEAPRPSTFWLISVGLAMGVAAITAARASRLAMVTGLLLGNVCAVQWSELYRTGLRATGSLYGTSALALIAVEGVLWLGLAVGLLASSKPLWVWLTRFAAVSAWVAGAVVFSG